MNELKERLARHFSEDRTLRLLVYPYWEILRERWNHRPGARYVGKDPDSIEFDSKQDAVVFHVEYNDACNCHPEMCDAALRLPLEWTGMTPLELMDYLLAKDRAAAEAEIEEKRKEEAKWREAAEKKEKAAKQEERELYLKLKEKYEGG